jgi:hypothetical protein
MTHALRAEWTKPPTAFTVPCACTTAAPAAAFWLLRRRDT